jgi:hypothetical protein
MIQQIVKKFLPHLIVLVLFIIASIAYFGPAAQGKAIFQSDIVQYQGMAKQLKDYRRATGEETYWTDSAFGGMPTYQLGAKYPYNFIKKLDLTLRFLPRPADYLFLYFIGMYILFLSLKLDYKLAFVGALAFGFSTYLIIILGVGHNAKAHAIAYMPLVLSGIILTFRGKYIPGFIVLTLGMALELVANHFQMTYYLLLLVVCIGVAYLIDAYKKKMLPHFAKAIAVMMIGVLIAVGLNATNILATKEYADASTRGKSELTINPDNSPKEGGSGLSYDYITKYSYGIAESFNLFIPSLMGGGSGDQFPVDSEAEEVLLRMGASRQDVADIMQQVPLYWGDQPGVAAPAYIGAVIIFLAVLAMFLVRGRIKWWIVTAFFLSLFLSWGDNFRTLTEFAINYVPLYNKFRAVTSIQVIIELVMPLIAIVGLNQLLNDFVKPEKKLKALYYSAGIVGGLAVLFLLFKSTLFDFESQYDVYFIEDLGIQFVDAIREDRMNVFTSDTLRSLIFVLLTAGVIWGHLKYKLNKTLVIAGVALLIVVDLVGVDRRYVNNDDFVDSKVMERPFQKNGADLQILEDEDYYRVYDETNNAFNSAQASFYHNALGGYHAAKIGRVQDLEDFYISKGDVGVLNMFNVRYKITKREGGGEIAQRNPYPNGPAWFVENAMLAETANHEIQLLKNLDSKRTAIIHKDFKEFIPLENVVRDSSAAIELVSQKPQHIVYETSSNSPQLAVFSEVYYPKGWNAYVNGKVAPYFRADYALRAMAVPEGNNKIEFKFEPKVIKTGTTITLAASVVFLLLLIGCGYLVFLRVIIKETTS